MSSFAGGTMGFVIRYQVILSTVYPWISDQLYIIPLGHTVEIKKKIQVTLL